MHGAAPITQYMAASIQFNPLSQQIIIYVRAKLVRSEDFENGARKNARVNSKNDVKRIHEFTRVPKNTYPVRADEHAPSEHCTCGNN